MNTKTLLFPILALALLFGCQKQNPAPIIKEPAAPLVNAGPSLTTTLPVDSVRLNGHATDSASKITGYIWSEVSGPNVPVFSNDGAASTLVSGLTAGTYIFQLMAVDSLGLTGVDTTTVTVKPRLSVTDTLRTFFPGSSFPFELTFLNNAASPAGNNRDIELLAETWTINAVTVYGRSFFKFNLSPVPAGTVIKSARLTLFSDTIPQHGDLIHANSGTNNDFFIQRVAGSWDLTNTDWNNQPATDTAGQVHIPQTSQPFLNLVNVDVTQMVNNMIASGNNGFVMKLNTEVIYNSRIFCSSGYSDPNRRPYLIVTY